MTAKEFLQQGYKLNERIAVKFERLEMLRTKAEKTTQALSWVPRGHNTADRIAEIVAQMYDIERESLQEIKELLTISEDISSAIKAVPDPRYKVLLESRYILYKGWKEISADLECSMSTAVRWHDEALKMVKVPKRYEEIEYDRQQ